MILHSFKKNIDGFIPERITVAVFVGISSQCVCFIDEKYTVESRLYDFVRFDCCLASKAPNEFLTITFDKLWGFQNAKPVENHPQDTSDSSLAGARISCEDKVQ